MLESSFLINLQAFSLQVFSKEAPTQVLSCEVCKTYNSRTSANGEGHLQTAVLEVFYKKAFLKNFEILTEQK